MMYSPSSSMGGPSGPGAFAQASPEYSQGPPRKKMRKGTKSCLECRRRKIKCTFEADRPAVCNECYARGSTCIDQEHGELQPSATSSGEQSYSLRERVTQLEGLVREVLDRLPANNAQQESASPASVANAPGQGETHAAAEALKNLKTSISGPAIESGLSLPGGRHEDAPALSLFDNAVIFRKKETPTISAHQHNKSKRLLRELDRVLPQPKDLEIMLDVVSQWWKLFAQMFPLIKDPRYATFKESVTHSLRSDNPAEVAKIILCIAISMNQMSLPIEDKLGLPYSLRDFLENCVNTVDQLITSDDEIGATVEGIECMVLEAKYHVNLGRPRRAYILYRRAISFCQLIGLHRIGKRPASDDLLLQRQNSLWTHVFQGDRYLSLILGLPYGVPERFCTTPVPNNNAEMRPGEAFMFRLTGLMGKLIDRNQDPENMSFSTTLRIDAELDEMSHDMPASWWHIERDPNTPIAELFDRLMAQMFHHQLRTYIHLPYMLNVSDKRYHYSHESAVNSSRQIVKIYSMLRDDSEIGPYVCKLVDFQAFAAAMLLLLNLLGYSHNARAQAGFSSDHGQSKEQLEQDVRDWAMIDETIACLKKASNEAGGIVAAQSAKALELLAAIRDRNDDCQCDNDSTCEIAIPMFGVLRIGAGSKFRVPQQPAKMPVSVSNISAGACGSPNLPTPPASTATQNSSSIHGCSTQPSPVSSFSPSLSTSLNAAPNLQPTHNKVISGNDDQIISFDNFMGLPQTDFFPLQPNPDGQGYGSLGPSHGLDSLGSNGLGSWPFPAFGAGIVDLDHGWNWSGDGDLAADWNTGMNTGFQGL